MKSRPAVAEEGLRRRWHRWAEIVRLLARRPEAVDTIPPAEYHDLHAELLGLCTVRARQKILASDRQAIYHKVVALVRPWGSPEALSRAGGEELRALLERCREISDALGDRRGHRGARRWKRTAVVAALVVVAVALVVWLGDGMPKEALWAVRRWFRFAVRPVTGLSAYTRIMLLGGLAALVAILAVWRSSRWTG